jgi:endo-alpha-1,4-polygalactosaminidase (GH114 family)
MKHYIEEIIAKFDAIKSDNNYDSNMQRFNHSPVFHKTVHALANGIDPIYIIDMLLTMNENTQKKIEELVRRSPIMPITNRE